MNITDDRIEAALKKMAATDSTHAAAKGEVERLNLVKKTIEAAAYLDAPKGTVAEKESYVYTTPEYQAHCEAYKQAVPEYQRLTNERERERLIIEVWRTVSSNRRSGNI